MKTILTILLLILLIPGLRAQDMSVLNTQRINTNKTGLLILTGWGAANLASGAVGYFINDNIERKSFHGMNAIWGITNGLIGYVGYRGAMKENSMAFDTETAAKRYRSNKRLYLINAGLDVLYISTGAFIKYGIVTHESRPDFLVGFSESFMLQGIALLVFDCAMYGLLQTQNKKWAKLASGISFTGNGIGYVYRF